MPDIYSLFNDPISPHQEWLLSNRNLTSELPVIKPLIL